MKIEAPKNPLNNPAAKSIKENLEYVPEDYKKFAKNKEQLFLQLMLNEMNKTVIKEDQDSSATDYYKSLLTSERAKTMSENNGGIGIQKMILDEIYPRSKRNLVNFNAYNAQKTAFLKKTREKMQEIEMKKQEQIQMHKPNKDNVKIKN